MQLYYQSYGEDGPPLIILHGLLGASGNWHTLSRNVFSKAFRVFALDQRNHGRSPHSDELDYDVMADDVRDFMEQQKLDRTHLLGHSMGGKTAMQAALAYPERVEKLVVADMAPKAYPPHHTEIIEALRKLDPSQHENRGEIDAALAEKVESRRMRQFLLKNLLYEDGNYTWQMNLEAIRAGYDRISAALDTDGRTFDGPALFLRGGESDYLAEEDMDAVRQTFPQARLETIEGAGHWLHADKPQAFAEAVMAFLTEGEQSSQARVGKS